MMSNKILITLTILFIINCDCGKHEDCKAILVRAGFSEEIGFLNFIMAKQFICPNMFIAILHKDQDRVFQNKTIYDLTKLKSTDVYQFFYDNIELQSEIMLQDPNEFCKQQYMFQKRVKKCTENIKKSYGDKNAYGYILKSMEILLSYSVDESGKKESTELLGFRRVKGYAELLKFLPATKSLESIGCMSFLKITTKTLKLNEYIEVLKKKISEEKKFENCYKAVDKLKDEARDYWYYHIKILKSIFEEEENNGGNKKDGNQEENNGGDKKDGNQEENNGGDNNSKYFTTTKWCQLKYPIESEDSNISTEN